jgi:hypothetical protein
MAMVTPPFWEDVSRNWEGLHRFMTDAAMASSSGLPAFSDIHTCMSQDTPLAGELSTLVGTVNDALAVAQADDEKRRRQYDDLRQQGDDVSGGLSAAVLQPHASSKPTVSKPAGSTIRVFTADEKKPNKGQEAFETWLQQVGVRLVSHRD